MDEPIIRRKKPRIALSIDAGLLSEVTSYCDEFGCNLSGFFSIAARQYLNNNKMVQNMPEMLQTLQNALQQVQEQVDKSDK